MQPQLSEKAPRRHFFELVRHKKSNPDSQELECK